MSKTFLNFMSVLRRFCISEFWIGLLKRKTFLMCTELAWSAWAFASLEGSVRGWLEHHLEHHRSSSGWAGCSSRAVLIVQLSCYTRFSALLALNVAAVDQGAAGRFLLYRCACARMAPDHTFSGGGGIRSFAFQSQSFLRIFYSLGFVKTFC